MTCGGRTYVVNEDDGFCNGRKVRRYRDSSFRSMVGFMLLILLFWVLVSCIIYGIKSTKDKKTNSKSPNNTQDSLHNDKYFAEKSTTVSPPIKEYDEGKHNVDFVPTVIPAEKNKSSTSTTTPTVPVVTSDGPHHHHHEKVTESYPEYSDKTTKKYIEKDDNTFIQTTKRYEESSSSYLPHFTKGSENDPYENQTSTPLNSTEIYQKNDQNAITENIIQKKYESDDKQLVKESNDVTTMAPVTEIFITENAYTVGQNGTSTTPYISSTAETTTYQASYRTTLYEKNVETNISQKPQYNTTPTTSTVQETIPQEKQSQNPSIVESTTAEMNLLTTLSGREEEIRSKFNTSQKTLYNVTTSQKTSVTEQTIVNDIDEESSSKSNSSIKDFNTETTVSQDSSIAESTTAEMNLLTTLSGREEEIRSKFHTSQKTLYNVTTSQKTSVTEQTIVNNIDEESSSNSNSSKKDFNTETTISQKPSIVESTTAEMNLLTTLSGREEEIRSTFNTSQKTLYNVTTSEKTSVTEPTIVNNIDEESSSKSNPSIKDFNTETTVSQDSIAEMTTSRTNLLTTSSETNEEIQSKSITSQKTLYNVTTPLDSSVTENIMQTTLSTATVNGINEAISSKSKSDETELSTETSESQSSSILDVTTSQTNLAVEQSSNFSTDSNQMDISTESSQYNAIDQGITEKTDIVEVGSSSSGVSESKLKVTTEDSYTTTDNVLTTRQSKENNKNSYDISNNEPVSTYSNSTENPYNSVTATQQNILEKEENSTDQSSKSSIIKDNNSTSTTTEYNTKRDEVTSVEKHVTTQDGLSQESTTEKTELPDLSKSSSTMPTPAFREPPLPEKNDEVEACKTSSCMMTSSEILKLIDHKTEPCENFYQFSCGDYQNENKNTLVEVLLEAYYTKKISKRGEQRSLLKFFETCLDYEEKTSFTDKISKVRNINVRKDDLTQLLKYLITRQSTPFFDIRFGPMNKEEPYTVQLLPPSSGYHKVGLKNWSLKKYIEEHCHQSCMSYQYQQKISLEEVHNKYKTCQRDTFKKIAEDFFTTYNTSVSDEEGFLSFFLNIMFDTSNLDIQQEMLNKNYRKLTVDELSVKYDAIDDWIGLFKNISYGKFNGNTSVYILMDDEYFKPLMHTIQRMKKNPNFLNHLATYFQLELGEYLLKPITDRNRFCMEQSVELMPELANHVFVQYTKLKKSNVKIFNELFVNIKDEYYWIIDQSELEEKNKVLLKNELETLKLRDFIDLNQDKKHLSSLIDNIDLSGDHLSTVFMIRENRRQFSYHLSTPVDTYILYYLLDDPFDFRPKYIPYTKTIVIPNAYVYDILNIQNNKIPKYVYTTKIKFHLSRAVALYLQEIIVDAQSRFYKQFGKYLDLYLRGEEPFYLHGQEITYKLNNESIWDSILDISLTNRLADNWALKVAFSNTFGENSMKSSPLPWISELYSPEKQFFILIAQEYCKKSDVAEMSHSLFETSEMTPTLRIENLMIHSTHFHEQFKCAQGTRMNPEMDKVQFDSFVTEDYDYQS